MFERFTERARQVVVQGQEEARALRHNYIGTEHLLLGLLRVEDGLAAEALGSLGVTLEEARAQVTRIVGEGDAATSGQIPFTPRAKKALEQALREAISIGHSYIGTEHILLGLVRENEGVAARILLDFDVDSEQVRQRVFELLPPTSRARPRPGLRGRRAGTFAMPPHPQWEYRIERRDALDHAAARALSALGTEGWELIAIVPRAEGHLQLVLKRRFRPPPFVAEDVSA